MPLAAMNDESFRIESWDPRANPALWLMGSALLAVIVAGAVLLHQHHHSPWILAQVVGPALIILGVRIYRASSAPRPPQ